MIQRPRDDVNLSVSTMQAITLTLSIWESRADDSSKLVNFKKKKNQNEIFNAIFEFSMRNAFK